jgi:glycosyltransferase involved in cell wall biosynthesis
MMRHSMKQRLKVLMSAYACEPDKGSEPEVGWQWAMQMARFHEVTVLTRANNRPGIEKKLMELPRDQPVPEFVYHEEALFLQQFKQRLSSLKLYYVLWQRSARAVVARLHADRQFDLLHHVTFAGFRYPTAIWGHGVPCIWGPVGGIESVPWRLLPWGHPRSLFAEIKRNIHNLLQAAPLQVLPKRARASTVILACTPEMQLAFQNHGHQATLMPTIGLPVGTMVQGARQLHEGGIRLLFVGNIITLKGIDLALRALKESGTDATLTLIGSGNYQAQARTLVNQLGLENRVTFAGKQPRADVLKSYAAFDVFLFPSLHDTGGYAVIEAMFNGLPVICLDCAGPAVAVSPDCGVKVPLETKAKVCSGLAAAIKQYDQDRALLHQHGTAARARVLQHYDWDQKGVQMNEVYQKAIERRQSNDAGQYTGIGLGTHFIHRLISFKGLAATVIMLLLIGVLGFGSLNHLNFVASEVVQETLPRMALASQANAYLADASRTVTFIFTESPEERVKIRQEIEDLSERTTSLLQQYGELLDANADHQLYERLMTERKDYFLERNQILELAAAGQREQAIKNYTESLLPAHNRIKNIADELFNADIQQGEVHSHAIMKAGRLTQVAVALIGVAVFVLGFFLGLFR